MELQMNKAEKRPKSPLYLGELLKNIQQVLTEMKLTDPGLIQMNYLCYYQANYCKYTHDNCNKYNFELMSEYVVIFEGAEGKLHL